MTSPCPPTATWKHHLAGDLSADESAHLTAHLADCPSCRDELGSLVSVAGTHAEAPGGEPSGLTHPIESVADELALAPGLPQRIGQYRILGAVGRGGMGVVYRALDERLRRVVALKVLAPELAADATARARFLREARAAAAVVHDHVVPIHGVDDEGGLPYLVMHFVEGESLQDRLRRLGRLPPEEVLRLGMEIASGLAAAHAKGLVHRDVKPANLLLEGERGRVRITDFGLARAVEGDDITQLGHVAGTPRYMSPEQTRGDFVDHRSDLFSLGTVLYEMAAGAPPFAAKGMPAALRAVREDTAPPLHNHAPDAPEWLEQIITQLLAKDPADRFQSAAEVAELLGRQLTLLRAGLTVTGLPALPRRKKRSRLPLLLGGLALAAAAAALWYFTRPDNREGFVEFEGSAVEKGKVVFERDGHAVATIPAIGSKYLTLPPGTYRVRLDGADPGYEVAAEEITVRPEGRAVVTFRYRAPPFQPAPPGPRGEARKYVGHTGAAAKVALSPDGKTAASAGHDKTVRLWNVETGQEIARLEDHRQRVWAVAYSPDGKWLLSGGGGFNIGDAKEDTRDGVLRLWDQSGRLVRRLEGHQGTVYSVKFSPDGKHAVSAGTDCVVIVWDVASGKELRRFTRHTGEVVAADFAPDGRSVLSAGADRVLRLWDVETAAELRTFTGHEHIVTAVAFSPDGKRALSCGLDRTVRLWDLGTGSGRVLAQLPSGQGWVAFSPDGRRALAAGGWGYHRRDFAVAGEDETVRVWDLDSDRPPLELIHQAMPTSAVFTPDGKHVLSGVADGSLSLWRLEGPPPARPPAPAPSVVWIHDAGKTAFLNWAKGLSHSSYRPSWVQIHDAGGVTRGSGVAVKNRGSFGWWVHYEPNGPARLVGEAEKLAADKGLRPASVSVRTLGGGVEFAVIFNDGQPDAELLPALAAGNFPEFLKRLREDRKRPLSLAAYQVGGAPRFAAVIGPADKVAWGAFLDLTEKQYGDELDKARTQGHRPVSVSVTREGPALRFALVTAKDRPDVEWVERRGLTADELRDEAAALAGRGYVPTLIVGYAAAGESRYLAVWEREKGKP